MTRPHYSSHLRESLFRFQDSLAHALGVDLVGRPATVGAMLASNARRAPGYWLQLLLAAGIATLGLVLGSTAVVIGAMLVSPLMGPILELGMGFAVGSSLLVLRACFRVVLSIVAVIATAALITVMLPFHEVTAEISSRTAPTLLDLLIAVFCALTAAYTTVRQTTDTTAAAAGTAIGIALVPPLCVTGFGLGTASGRIASGAALLFTANLSAILVVAVVSFLLLGFSRVDAGELEHKYLEHPRNRTERIAQTIHQYLRHAFGSRYGLAMRLLVPTAFLLAVAVPLSRALDEVGWEVRAREAVRTILAQESPRAMQTFLSVERSAVTLRLVIVGAPEQAAELEGRLAARIAAVAGVVPKVTVTAVPDARALATIGPARSAAAEAAAVSLADAGGRIEAALAATWPPSAGRLLGWSLELSRHDGAVVTTRHLGPPIGHAAEELLAGRLSQLVGSAVRVADAALPAAPLVARSAPEDTVWLAAALGVLAEVPRMPNAMACVSGPIGTGRAGAPGASIRTTLERSPAGRTGRLSLAADSAWSIHVGIGGCAPADSAGTAAYKSTSTVNPP